MASLNQISRRLEENDFTEGDSFWLSLREGRIELEVISIDTQHEYNMPLFAIKNVEIRGRKREFGEMTRLVVEGKNRSEIREALPSIAKMLEDGFTEGIDRPFTGIHWTLE